MANGRNPGVRIEDDAVQFFDSGLPPQAVGEVRRNGDDLFAQDSAGVFNLRQATITPTEIGQIAISMNGTTFTAQKPIVDDATGQIVTDDVNARIAVVG